MDWKRIEDFVARERDESGIYEVARLRDEVKFRLPESPEITVRIYEYMNQERLQYCFNLSHYIHGPTQAGAYVPSRPCYDSPEIAFERGVRSITDFFNEAVKEGHQPHRDWFVEAS